MRETRRGGARGLRPVAPRPAPGPHGRGIPRAVRDRAVHGARAGVGNRTDPRSDLFALGVLMYFFSTGVRPSATRSAARPQAAHLVGSGPAATLRPGYPPWLQEIVLRCLEVDPLGGIQRPPISRSISRTRAGQAHGALGETPTRFMERSDPPPLQPGGAPAALREIAAPLAAAPIVMVAVDMTEGGESSSKRCASRSVGSSRSCRGPGSRS